MSLTALGICDAAELLASGKVTSVELVDACLNRIEEFDPGIQAWAWLKPEYARRQAARLDEQRSQNKPLGRLHGIPIGLKDIIDTRLIPTEYGFQAFEGRLPSQNATIVDRLATAGAVMMGKTVTARLATFMPGKTANPHNSAHTPGGSSSGSAAAVASFMVPGAVGTQTNGSVIRPASYCGTVGFKPSYGLIPRTGILRQSPFLDQVGVFARSVPDVALLAEVMIGADDGDTATHPGDAIPPLLHICNQSVPLPPRFAFIKTSRWEHLDKATQMGFEEVCEALSPRVDAIDLGAGFDSAWKALETINAAEIATWYASIYQSGKDFFDTGVVNMMEQGQQVSARDYINAMQSRPLLNTILDGLFDDYDAILTPAAAGEAPFGLESTGNPEFCTPWTFCGVPAITLPLLQGENGLPIGVQLVGQNLDDARLLRSARWLMQELGATNPE